MEIYKHSTTLYLILEKRHQVMVGVNARLLASDECTCRRWNATRQTWNEELNPLLEERRHV